MSLSYFFGIAKFSSAGVVLDFERQILGMVSQGMSEVRLPLDEIFDVRFRPGFLKRWSRIEIRLRSFAQYSDLPTERGKIVLRLVPGDWQRAKEAVAALEQGMTEQAAAALPSANPPLISLFDESENTTKDLKQKLDQ